MPKETMTSRERMLAALNHREPDRVPIDLGGNQTGIHKFAYQALAKHLGADSKLSIMDDVQQLARPSEEVLQRFHVDTPVRRGRRRRRFQGGDRHRASRRPALARSGRRVRRSLVDARRSAALHGHHAPPHGECDARRHPQLSVPQGRRSGPFRRLRERAMRLRKETPYAIISGICGVVYEYCWYMRGLEQWFMDMVQQPEFCEALLDQTLKFWLDFVRVFLDEVGDLIDVIMVGDDLAGQKGPLFRPAFYRRIVKPRQKQLVQYIHTRTKAKVWYHTCGACTEYIPDLLDNGIDILNPVQISASGMEPRATQGLLRRPAWFSGAVGSMRSTFCRPPLRRRFANTCARIWPYGSRAGATCSIMSITFRRPCRRKTSWPSWTPRMNSAFTIDCCCLERDNS